MDTTKITDTTLGNQVSVGTSRFMVGDGSKVKVKLFAQSVLLAITVYLPFFLA